MTLGELIQKVNTEKPNAFTDSYITKIVNEVEAMVYDYLETPSSIRVYLAHPDDAETDLMIPEPYSTAYESYVKARLDQANEEYDLYANHTAQFNEDFDSWKACAMRKGQVDTSEFPDKIVNWW